MSYVIEFVFDEKTCVLHIKYEGQDLKIKRYPLVDCLKKRALSPDKVIFQIILHIMDGAGVKVESKKDEVMVRF